MPESLPNGRIYMKLFKENKWEIWWDSLSPTTKAYIESQPIWHDRDLFKAVAYGFVVGVLLGLCF